MPDAGAPPEQSPDRTPGIGSTDDPPVPPATASSPLELSGPDWRQTLKRTVQQIVEDRVTIVAAGMAFYWFLAVFPAMLALVGLSGLVGAARGTASFVDESLRAVLPGDAAEVLTGALGDPSEDTGKASALAVAIGLVVALWSASTGMVAMQLGLDIAYDVPLSRTFLGKRVRALALMVATLVLGGIATALMVFGQPLSDWLWERVAFGPVIGIAWHVFRWVAAIGAVTLLFAVFYYVAPNRPSPRWQWVSPGGVIATLVWVAASATFSLYVRNFASYAQTYGSLAGVVVLILWLFITALAVLVGGEINAELERQSAIRSGETSDPAADASDAQPAS
ncbi:MAG TPA: YihY/virulence factor BrkB family protein [Actinomycetota bacterium]|nr:YihY/virulence factor BrkB family protein [Actinomycetota bacterium]